MLRQLQPRRRDHLVMIKETRLLKQLFYIDVVIGARRPGGPKRRYKDTPKNSLKGLHISPETWEDLSQNRPTWTREVKTGAAVYEANRIAAARAEREARESQVPRLLTAKHPPLPTCPRSPLSQTPRRTSPPSPCLPRHHHRPPYPNPCIDCSGQHHHHYHVFMHSPHQWTTIDVPSPSTITTSTPASSDADWVHT
ncbi:hypothetical protein SprV_0100301400 [Sparganum proliferum]